MNDDLEKAELEGLDPKEVRDFLIKNRDIVKKNSENLEKTLRHKDFIKRKNK